MILRSDPSGGRNPRSGVSLFETMVALAILSLLVAVVAGAVRGPSPRLQQQAAIARILHAAQEVRLRAIQEGRAITMAPDHVCEEAPAPTFFADGSAQGGPLCIDARVIRIDPLTGTLAAAP